MKKRLIALVMALAMAVTLLAGCGAETETKKKKKDNPTSENVAQFAVAINPILAYDDGTSVVAFNDIKNAVKSDREGNTLAALYNDTGWEWSYKLDDTSWKSRATYALDSWTNGAGATGKKAVAYSFTDTGSTSLMPFAASSTPLETYQGDAVPDYGLILSGVAGEEEALTYTVDRDGKLRIPASTVTAISSVGGVETGFLAEDGTPRLASVRIMVNDQQVFSGTLCNATAAADGVALTSLSFDDLGPIAVTAGDMVFVAVKLDAQANADEDVTVPEKDDSKNWAFVTNSYQVEKAKESKNSEVEQVAGDKPLPIIDNYSFGFTLVRSQEIDSYLGDGAMRLISDTAQKMEEILQDEVLIRNEYREEQALEFVFGPMYDDKSTPDVVEGRPDSVKIYNEVKNARANNANDYIIRRIGGKIYFEATTIRAMQAAIDYFLATFVRDDEGVIPANFEKINRKPTINYTLNGVNVASYVLRVEKYPSLVMHRAAEAIQQGILDDTGYLLPIKNVTDAEAKSGKSSYKYQIQIGPMNGSVKMYRIDKDGKRNTDSAYLTRFTDADTDTYMAVDYDGLLDVDDTVYSGKLNGNTFVLNGGTDFAINAGAMKFVSDLRKTKQLKNGYAINGKYAYRTDPYSLYQGYALTLAEEFNYDPEEVDAEATVRKRWSISNDTTTGPTGWGQQRRPGVYGENWWIWNDATGNGYALEITKKESYGYDAGRLIGMNKYAYRYGIWETKLVMGTHNGACSAVWASSAGPDQPPSFRNEFDLYENYGQDGFHANIHSWSVSSDTPGVDENAHLNHISTGQMLRKWIDPEGHWGDPTGEHPGEHFYDTFHNMTMEWFPNRVDFYLDGNLFQSVDTSADIMRSCKNSTTTKLANGVGTDGYASGHDPHDFISLDQLDNFFEVQVVDYSRIYQFENTDTTPAKYTHYIKYQNSTIEKAWALTKSITG